ncbi:hypothetical protein [uncultured Clostridium sp.]|uniref:hypothetical protein n=1 Tax=uncultured Clostridium sp. TaxID=59620 RepID=UPI0028ED59B2|nr:hypothetical protein [uncultured Clostridium sp.]
MKRRISLLLLGVIITSSISAYAADRKDLQETKFTGWSYDGELNKDTYYKDGKMIKNQWINTNNSWYFLNVDGAKVTGWQNLNNSWYYFDTEGNMETGWVRDISGKYYYLNSNGTMAHDTTIDGYQIGSDGAWIK